MIDKLIMKSQYGHEIWCYGDIEEDSNFSIICDDECNDIVAPGLEDENGEPPTSWKQVIEILEKRYEFKDIEEISSC